MALPNRPSFASSDWKILLFASWDSRFNSLSVFAVATRHIIKLSCTARGAFCENLENGFPILSVRDNGLGIDLSMNRDKLFGMYKTFHEHPQSKGVGLFITKTQVEALGGFIEVESEVHVGTCFKIYLEGK